MTPGDGNPRFGAYCMAWFRDGFARIKLDAGLLGFTVLVLISLASFSEATSIGISDAKEFGFAIAGGMSLIAAAIALHRKD